MCHVLFVPGGQTFLSHRRGGTNISYTQEGEGDKHFSHTGGGTNIFFGGGGAYDDVVEELDVS